MDLSAGELRKSGVRIRLQEQPFQVLTFLLSRPGDVITREEFQQKLWPADTFVDFDHSLNTAVNKLREALGDSASSPRYIETLARRGYRFLATVNAPVDVHGDRTTHSDQKAPELDNEIELPTPHRGVARALFGLLQIMYLVFYVIALIKLQEVETTSRLLLPPWAAFAIAAAVMVTAGIGIPLRCYLFSAVAFDHRRLGENFQRLFLLILPLDQLWAVAPFLLAQKIGAGAAFAATAALLYVPFSERTLVKMAYPRKPPQIHHPAQA